MFRGFMSTTGLTSALCRSVCLPRGKSVAASSAKKIWGESVRKSSSLDGYVDDVRPASQRLAPRGTIPPALHSHTVMQLMTTG